MGMEFEIGTMKTSGDVFYNNVNVLHINGLCTLTWLREWILRYVLFLSQ